MKLKRIDIFDGAFAFLSNFYESPFTFEGITYPTNEHFFQAMKTLDVKERKTIAAARTPGVAKRMGRQVDLISSWEETKDDIMYIGLKFKFSDPDLAQKLLATGDAELVEGTTWHDQYWGICTCDKCQGAGENKLGQLLMRVRDDLREEALNKLFPEIGVDEE